MTKASNVVLVHGAWADGSSWSKIVPILRKHDLRVTAVQLPLTSLQNDVQSVERALALFTQTVHFGNCDNKVAIVFRCDELNHGPPPALG